MSGLFRLVLRRHTVPKFRKAQFARPRINTIDAQPARHIELSEANRAIRQSQMVSNISHRMPVLVDQLDLNPVNGLLFQQG